MNLDTSSLQAAAQAGRSAYPVTSGVAPALYYLPSVTSTNDVLPELWRRNPSTPAGTVLVADQQTQGRGRQGRQWLDSPQKSLLVSMLCGLPDGPEALANLPWAGLLAASALREALVAVAVDPGQGTSATARLKEADIAIKWPNDILVQGKKVAGILTEYCGKHADTLYLVIGVGLNVAHHADDLPFATATSLQQAGIIKLEAEVDAVGQPEIQPAMQINDRILADYHQRLTQKLANFAAQQLDPVLSGALAEVSAHCLTLGQEVRVTLPGGETLTGTAQRLLAQGIELIQPSGETVVVTTGDVDLLPGYINPDK